MTTIDEIRAELDERIDDAARKAADSHKLAMNSYGAGYDAGFVAALRELRECIDRDPEPHYTTADIEEYLRLLQRRRQGYDGPMPTQWRGVEQYLTPFVQE